jgi:hypothetical protein
MASAPGASPHGPRASTTPPRGRSDPPQPLAATATRPKQRVAATRDGPAPGVRGWGSRPVLTVGVQVVAPARCDHLLGWSRRLRAVLVAAGDERRGSRPRVCNQIPSVVGTIPRERGSRHVPRTRWASQSCASSKTWPHPPVRRQQCARSAPIQCAPQHDIPALRNLLIRSCGQGSSTGRPAAMSVAS